MYLCIFLVHRVMNWVLFLFKNKTNKVRFVGILAPHFGKKPKPFPFMNMFQHFYLLYSVP